MIDFHSHILPAMDDGSKNAEESIKMLEMLTNQGITRVVATPHFHANHESVDNFITRREKSYSLISENLNNKAPEIKLGAEVRYYEGISRMENLDKLCIQDTKALLIEMPSTRWTKYTIDELFNLSSSGTITIILAHIERYMDYQSRDIFDALLGNDILMQINASYINSFLTRKKALRLIREQKVHLIGSDCHNLTDRSPDMGTALNTIQKKLDNEFFNYFVNYGNKLFL